LNSSTDLILRRFTIKVPEDEQAALVFIDGLTDKTIINEHMLRPLMLDSGKDGRAFINSRRCEKVRIES
ncbi:MAG TPA: spore germination protein, partial [Bacillota bacterium]|nr:spore germination protein [Bacillota bacterium]